jgi:hypothetical protein
MAAIVADVSSDNPNGDCGVNQATFSINECSLQWHLTIFGGRPAQRHFDLYRDWTANYQRIDASPLAPQHNPPLRVRARNEKAAPISLARIASTL